MNDHPTTYVVKNTACAPCSVCGRITDLFAAEPVTLPAVLPHSAWYCRDHLPSQRRVIDR